MPILYPSSNRFKYARSASDFRARRYAIQNPPPFSPSVLFAAMEQGAWYDPSDLSTLFQDAAGTTAVTAVEQPVGLMLDKSRGLVLGPEVVVNGDFSSGTTGWVSFRNAILSTSNDELVITNSSTTFGSAYQLFDATPGKRYKISCVARLGTTDAAFLSVRTADGQTTIASTTASSTTIATLTIHFVATATAHTVFLGNGNAAGTTSIFDNISVRELPGNHATQTTATSRPVLSARYNLLTKTEQFDDAVWTKSATTIGANTTATTDPLGGNSADKLIETTANDNHAVNQLLTWGAGTFKWSCFAKAAERNWCTITSFTSGIGARRSFVNLANGTAGTINPGHTLQIVAKDDGWYQISVVSTEGSVSTSFYIGTATGNNGNSYTGDGTSGIYLWGASLVPANQSDLPYQRVNTATDYDSDPTKFPRYLRCDGIDDGMVTGTITPGTDKAQVFAGVRSLAGGQYRALLEMSANADDNVGTFLMSGNGNLSTYRVAYVSRGTATAGAFANNTAYNPPVTLVQTGVGDISGDRATLRINGTQAAQSTADQGTGNYLAYPLYLFRRGGTTLPFNGHFYGAVIRFGPNLPIETIEQTEAWMAAKTGVTL